MLTNIKFSLTHFIFKVSLLPPLKSAAPLQLRPAAFSAETELFKVFIHQLTSRVCSQPEVRLNTPTAAFQTKSTSGVTRPKVPFLSTSRKAFGVFAKKPNYF